MTFITVIIPQYLCYTNPMINEIKTIIILIFHMMKLVVEVHTIVSGIMLHSLVYFKTFWHREHCIY